MPVTTPNGYLDFTNATPRATKVIATSNIGVGTSDPIYSLDVLGTANVGALSATSVDIAGGLSLDLPVATIASNLVTYDTTSGQLFDSGGLFSNKLAVVSEQPPVALTGETTTVTGHGRYAVTASTPTNAQNIFAKTAGSLWSGAAAGYNTNGSYAGSALLATGLTSGEWVSLSLPYKVTLRHYVVEQGSEELATTFPRQIKLYGSNDEGTSWTLVNTATSLSGTSATVLVNATEKYKKYGFVFVETNNSTQLRVGELRLFAESFSIDGGKIEMASSAITGGNAIMDQTGPHGRGAAKLKKYPEVAMTSNVGVGGYVVSASDYSSTRLPYKAFNNTRVGSEDSWIVTDPAYNTSTGVYSGNARLSQSSGTPIGEWLKIQSPVKFKLASYVIYPRDSQYYNDQAPVDGEVWGSNDNSTWEFVHEYSGLSFPSQSSPYILNVGENSKYYKYYALIVTKNGGDSFYAVSIGQLEYYGYEETSDPDTSVDTTITSVYNLPDTKGMKLYLDGDKGSTPTDYSGEGHTLTNNSESFSGNAWSFTSLATSNVTMSTGDLAMEGTHPHSVSLWFNAANISSNATLFHVGTAAGEGDAKTSISLTESGHLGWIDGGDNQFLSSNTWHNLVYATQGGGGLRTCYLDGRKLGDVSDQDTFGEYPPFAMTGYSQGGYTVSASTEYNSNYQVWEAFEDITGNSTNYWSGSTALYSASSPYNFTGSGDPYETTVSGTMYTGDWIQIEMPHKIKLDYVTVFPREINRFPRQGVFAGSNDGQNWDLIHSFSGLSTSTETNVAIVTNSANNAKAYKYIRLVITHLNGGTYAAADNIRLYGHKENDTTRFPVSSTVLKYPHIAMTGQAQRGYVASASSENNTTTNAAYGAFDGISNGINNRWRSTSVYVNNDLTATPSALDPSSPQTQLDTNTSIGEYLIIELPSKIKLKNIVVNGPHMHMPYEVDIYGRNESVSTWTHVKNYIYEIPTGTDTSAWNTTNQTIDATQYYLEYAFVVVKTNGHVAASIGELELYGTEEDLDIVARVGEGLDGKVANFRVYDKYLHEEQALEMWDAQKDQFGRATSSVSVYRGHLGIGTTTPEAALTVMDEAHESEEFPPRAMTGYETYMDGHGVFKASAISVFESGYEGWRVFDKATNVTLERWTSLTTTSTIGSLIGKWVKLELPYHVNFNKIGILPPTYLGGSAQCPTGFSIIASNDDETWTIMKTLSSYTWKEFAYNYFTLENDGYFKYIAVVATTDGSNPYTSFQEIRYFGTRERGQSTLHDGELKLTKNLTVPRIGPPLDADDTPQRDRLVVEYNTSTNSTENGMVRDTSGRGNDGLMVGGASYDATEKALVLDGTDDYLTPLTNLGISGDWVHSFSGWFKFDTFTTQNYLFTIRGPNTRNQTVTFRTETTGYIISAWYGNNITWGQLQTGVWYHICLTYPGSASANQKLYINGELQSITNLGSYSTQPLDIDIATVEDVRIGSLGDTTYYLDGSISNIKIYDVALTTDEVKRLYDMGRCDEGHHVVNFSKTRVGIGLGDGEAPRAALDVRGSIMSSGYILQQNVVCCRYINGGDQSVTNSAKIPFDGIVYDPNNLWSTASDAFVAPVAGVYLVHVNLMTDSSTSHDGNHEIYVNGSQFTPKLRGFGVVTGANNLRNANSHHMVPLQAGHELSIHSVLNGVWYGSTAYAHSHVSIHLISDI